MRSPSSIPCGDNSTAVGAYFVGIPQVTAPVFIKGGDIRVFANDPGSEFVVQSNQTVTMARTDRAMCYLTWIGGDFNGNGERLHIFREVVNGVERDPGCRRRPPLPSPIANRANLLVGWPGLEPGTYGLKTQQRDPQVPETAEIMPDHESARRVSSAIDGSEWQKSGNGEGVKEAASEPVDNPVETELAIVESAFRQALKDIADGKPGAHASLQLIAEERKALREVVAGVVKLADRRRRER
jgi:hypothetical protein